ncbi:hypothetical protein RUM44_008498 [Polyplax serrata]|uniref:Peptidoglycan binding-like domain-containing protein n=1 Tax=Polyplax serrata TaxID=468196 RepID=A0ABR1B8E0_POLSC
MAGYKQDYLMNFGYLPPSDKETGLLRTDDQLRSAIENLQSFANIPVTGELDEKTLELLKKPRCGLPDFQYPSRRRKRYTLHGQKWHYTNLTWSETTQSVNLIDLL